MNELTIKTLSVFNPYYLQKAQELERNKLKLVQYTSAEAAMSIISNNEVWLRNTSCMNDYSEVEHGFECLLEAFHSNTHGEKFKETINSIFPGITKKLTDLFDGWIPYFRSGTYIACVSEHPPEENKYGRLSMWRAYGGTHSVALVLNTKPFLSESDALHAYTNPVLYCDQENFTQQFGKLIERISTNHEFVKTLGKDATIGWLFDTFKRTVLCTKHPGFSEEREWRVIYTPDQNRSKHVTEEVKSIGGIPQIVHKIPLKDIPEEGFFGATVAEFIDRIIIGPNDQQKVLGKTFEKILENAGCQNPHTKIHYSGIPLR